jgi:hypothetical protein
VALYVPNHLNTAGLRGRCLDFDLDVLHFKLLRIVSFLNFESS